MAILREYLLRLTCCAVLCSIILSVMQEGRLRQILRLVAAAFLTVTARGPFQNWELPDHLELPGLYLQNGYEAAAAGEAFASDTRAQIIKEELEAYILDKACDIGCSIAVQVHMTEDGYPESVSVSGKIGEGDRKVLEKLLEEDLGISKERQQWIG